MAVLQDSLRGGSRGPPRRCDAEVFVHHEAESLVFLMEGEEGASPGGCQRERVTDRGRMPPSQGQDEGQLASSGGRQGILGLRHLSPEHPVLRVWRGHDGGRAWAQKPDAFVSRLLDLVTGRVT